MSAPSFAAASAEYGVRWAHLTVLPEHVGAVTAVARRILTYKDRFKLIEKATGVPWLFVGIALYRESNLNFHCHLHNGDPLTARTYHVPKDRPLAGNPPFRWEESAVDALTMAPHKLHEVQSWTLERFCFELEKYNGWGYRSRGICSPYLFSKTNQYERGKFASDGNYDPSLVDAQCGGLALLKVLMTLDASITFPVPTKSTAEVPPMRPKAPQATQVAPKETLLTRLLKGLGTILLNLIRKSPA